MKLSPSALRRGLGRVAGVCGGLLLLLLAGAAAAGSAVSIILESTHQDLLSGLPEFEGMSVTDSSSQTLLATGAFAAVSKTQASTYQHHAFNAMVGVSNGQPSLFTVHGQTLEMTGGTVGSPQRWFNAVTQFVSNAQYTDTIGVTFNSASQLPPATLEFIWTLFATHTERLRAPADQRPLYRLSHKLAFDVTANGQVAPIAVDSDSYDPDVHQTPPRFIWSLLSQDLERIDLPVDGLDRRVEVLRVRLTPGDEAGSFAPVELEATLLVKSDHNFLNDSSMLNYDLSGKVDYDFGSSADLVGVVVRDASGAVITDVSLTSAAGATLTVLSAIPELPAGAMLALGLTALAAAGRRQRG